MLIKKAYQNKILLREPRTCHLRENPGL